ncbi:MAG: hypothetical protein NTV24_03335 [Candidatus Woesebacteria bacterium]|nr:hypothetical protein [Candidatus Woesebacteria bacterium]
MNFTYKLFRDGREIDKVRTHSKRLVLSHLRTINWNDRPRVYLRVSYGKRIDSFGKLVTFYNDGDYEDKEGLWLAFEAFTEKE